MICLLVEVWFNPQLLPRTRRQHDGKLSSLFEFARRFVRFDYVARVIVNVNHTNYVSGKNYGRILRLANPEAMIAKVFEHTLRSLLSHYVRINVF